MFTVTAKFNKFSRTGKFQCVCETTPKQFATKAEADKHVEWLEYLNTNRTEGGKYFGIRVNGAVV